MLYAKAQRIPNPFDTGQRRKSPPFGVAFHTTGSGLPRAALEKGQDPFQFGINLYRESMGPTYLIGWRPGEIAAITHSEDVLTWHAGSQGAIAAALKSGAWRQQVSPATVLHYARVYGDKNPLSADGTTLHSVIPPPGANDRLVGVEMIPVTANGKDYWAPPMRPGLRFTKWQHDAARDLAADLARRYGWPAGWQKTRILSHEAVNPIERHDSGGGWDPGWIRFQPYIDMDHIQGSGSGMLVLLVGAVGLAYLIKRARKG